MTHHGHATYRGVDSCDIGPKNLGLAGALVSPAPARLSPTLVHHRRLLSRDVNVIAAIVSAPG